MGPSVLICTLLASATARATAPSTSDGPATAASSNPQSASDAAEAAFTAALAAERQIDLATEEAALRRCLAADPSGPRAAACRQRLDWLTARQDADRGYRSLTELLQVRRDWRSIGEDSARKRVSAVYGRQGIPPTLRVEAGLWLARNALDQRKDPAVALALAEALEKGPAREVDDALRGSITRLRAQALALQGQGDQARRVERTLAGSTTTPTVNDVVRLRRRGQLRLAAWGVIGAFAALELPLGLKGWATPPRPRPLGLVPLAIAAAGSGALAAARLPGAWTTFAWLLAALSVVHLLSAGALKATPERGLRAVLSGLAALASLGAVYLVLAACGALGWIGL